MNRLDELRLMIDCYNQHYIKQVFKEYRWDIVASLRRLNRDMGLNIRPRQLINYWCKMGFCGKEYLEARL